jgi:hypothetical protein
MKTNFCLVLHKKEYLIMFKNSIYVPTILTYYHSGAYLMLQQLI